MKVAIISSSNNVGSTHFGLCSTSGPSSSEKLLGHLFNCWFSKVKMIYLLINIFLWNRVFRVFITCCFPKEHNSNRRFMRMLLYYGFLYFYLLYGVGGGHAHAHVWHSVHGHQRIICMSWFSFHHGSGMEPRFSGLAVRKPLPTEPSLHPCFIF